MLESHVQRDESSFEFEAVQDSRNPSEKLSWKVVSISTSWLISFFDSSGTFSTVREDGFSHSRFFLNYYHVKLKRTAAAGMRNYKNQNTLCLSSLAVSLIHSHPKY